MSLALALAVFFFFCGGEGRGAENERRERDTQRERERERERERSLLTGVALGCTRSHCMASPSMFSQAAESICPNPVVHPDDTNGW